MGQRELALGIGAGGADELEAERLRPLAGDQADAAGGGMEDNEVAGLEAFGRQRPAQQVLGRQALQHHRGAGLEGDRVGQLADGLGRHHAQLAIGARGRTGVGRAVTGLQVRDALAHRLDDARGFHAELQRHRERIEPAALVGVDEVQAHRLVADPDLAGAGVTDIDLDELEFLGTAIAVDADCLALHARLLVDVDQ